MERPVEWAHKMHMSPSATMPWPLRKILSGAGPGTPAPHAWRSATDMTYRPHLACQRYVASRELDCASLAFLCQHTDFLI